MEQRVAGRFRDEVVLVLKGLAQQRHGGAAQGGQPTDHDLAHPRGLVEHPADDREPQAHDQRLGQCLPAGPGAPLWPRGRRHVLGRVGRARKRFRHRLPLF